MADVQVGERDCTEPLMKPSMTEIVCKAPPGKDASNVSISLQNETSVPNTASTLTYTGWPWYDAFSWESDLTLQVEGASIPTARQGHSLVNDGVGGLVLFGGRSTQGSHNDVHRCVMCTVLYVCVCVCV